MNSGFRSTYWFWFSVHIWVWVFCPPMFSLRFLRETPHKNITSKHGPKHGAEMCAEGAPKNSTSDKTSILFFGPHIRPPDLRCETALQHPLSVHIRGPFSVHICVVVFGPYMGCGFRSTYWFWFSVQICSLRSIRRTPPKNTTSEHGPKHGAEMWTERAPENLTSQI